MNNHLSAIHTTVASISIYERRPLGGDAEDLPDERVGFAVAVAVDRDQRLGEQVIEGGGEQVDQAVDRGAGRTIHPGLVLERQDHARPGRL